MLKLALNVAELSSQVTDRIVGVKTQVFFCGGHGGAVTYDGRGGPMKKVGGPIDRVYVLRSEGDLGGDHGLDITYGSIDFCTGPLAAEVELGLDDTGDTVRLFTFQENPDERAVVIRGGVPELGLPYDTVLFHGSVEPSEMRWILGNVTGRPPALPYSAYHLDFEIHPELLRRFFIGEPHGGVAVSAWCKIGFGGGLEEDGPYGPPFSTQQHLGSLRIFFDNPS